MRYHYVRLEAQHSKVCDIRTTHECPTGTPEFELFHFFEICYHLKDWIKEEPNYSELSDVEKFIDNSPALRICADICNRLKHRKLTRKLRSKVEPSQFRLVQIIQIGPDETIFRNSLLGAEITTERGNECGFALADECMSEWKRYIQENPIPAF